MRDRMIMKSKNTLKALAVIAVLVMVLATLYVVSYSQEEKTTLTVFHAGSLSIPLEEAEKEFEASHPGVDVQLEAAGSVDTIRKVTELNRSCDVLASADYSLIKSMMMDGGYADWYIQFAVNKMVIAYTNQSFGHEDINGTNWYSIMRGEGTKIGFSSPNDDPCGYRAMMVTVLASDYYGEPNLFNDLIGNHTAITVQKNGTDSTVTVPADDSLNPDDHIMIRPKETDLMAALESGDIDYLFIYQSVATQHASSGVRFLSLPPEIDLSDTDYTSNYSTVKVHKANGDISTGKPIVYGLTIPKNAQNRELAVEFISLLIGEQGQTIFRSAGQPPVVPAVASNVQEVPEALRGQVVQG